MGETRVDLHHLLEDLRDAYSGSLEETILTEIVANALDSGARTVRIVTDPSASQVSVLDDGSGMKRRDLARYHDIAASTKTRGEGIGFAGVGIKLGLLLSEEVITETRRGKSHVATQWSLSSRYRAPWKWITAPGRLSDQGTCVTLRVQNSLSPLLDAGYIEQTLVKHFEPLFHEQISGYLSSYYPSGIRFEINGHPVIAVTVGHSEVATLAVKLGRKRKPGVIGYLARHAQPLPEDRRGIAISTLGKVIKRGWDWLGMTPAQPEYIEGLLEAPGLAECLTLSKSDFIRTGPRGAIYLAYRKAMQEAVAPELAAWGEARSPDQDRQRKAARPIERDMERILLELTEAFPLLGSLVEQRRGGQRSLPMGSKPAEGGKQWLMPATGSDLQAGELEHAQAASETQSDKPAEPANQPDHPEPTPAVATLPDAMRPGRGGAKAPRTYGLRVDFEARAEGDELSRLVESTVWINTAHAAYQRSVASRSEGYHLALSVAMSLAPLAVTAAEVPVFLNEFMRHWGDALKPDKKKRRPHSRLSS